MIGQVELLNQIDTLIANNKFPKFSIIIGEEGYGKHELCKYISSKLNIDYLLFDNKIDDLRTFIDVVNSQADPFIYILQDGDSMAIGAKNSILKVVEEVPAKAHIILLINNRNSALATLLSRAFVFELNNYAKKELVEYCSAKGYDNVDSLIKVSNCPGEIEAAVKVNVAEIVAYAEKILDNIAVVSLPNAMKITSMINGTNEHGYDLRLFLNALHSVIIDRLEANPRDARLATYRNIVSLITEYSYKLRMRASNIKYVVDNFIINLWRITG